MKNKTKSLSLDDYIYSSILAYPLLYYKKSFEQSRLSVLNQLFLVIGNGIYYNPRQMNFVFNKDYKAKSISSKTKNRIRNGEKIVEVFYGGERKLIGKLLYILYEYEDAKKVYLYDDFLKLNIKYLKSFQEIPDDFDKSKIDSIPVVEFYPLQEEDFKVKPYPYDIKYTPMWDRANEKLIDKNLILKDWRDGIVEAYEWALNWMKSEEFDNDDYFNWSKKLEKEKDSYLIKKWNNKNNLEELCKEYEIPYKEYSSPKDMCLDLVEKSRKKYIKEAELIINTYK